MVFIVIFVGLVLVGFAFSNRAAKKNEASWWKERNSLPEERRDDTLPVGSSISPLPLIIPFIIIVVVVFVLVASGVIGI